MNTNFNYYDGPVNSAFDESHAQVNQGRHQTGNVLPPFQEQIQVNKKNESDEQNNLRNFRTRILEMDDEIQEMKKAEIEKQSIINQQIYQNSNTNAQQQNNQKPIYKDESISTNDLIEEQNRRIAELQDQLKQLSQQLTAREDDIKSTSHHSESTHTIRENENTRSQDENQILERIGDWSPKDPYRGPMLNLYFPFGSPGGGAPLRDEEGNIQTTVYGPTTLYRDPEEQKRKAVASQIFQENMKQELLEQKLRRLQDRQKIREPDQNLSDILNNLKGGKPRRDPITGILLDHHLPSSDITNIRYASPRDDSPRRQQIPDRQQHLQRSDSPVRDQIQQSSIRNNDPASYGLQLAQAAKERDMMRKLEKLREQQEVRQHNESWDHLWGATPSSSGGRFNEFNATRRSNHKNYYQYPLNSS